MGRTARWLWVSATCLMLVGCGLGGSSVSIDYHNPLSDKLSALKDSGQTAPLNTLTDFPWDQVFLFHEWSTRGDIEKAVGDPIIGENTYSAKASLLVFKQGEEVVRAVGIVGDYLRAQNVGPYGPDVLASAWGNGAVRLTMPGEPIP